MKICTIADCESATTWHRPVTMKPDVRAWNVVSLNFLMGEEGVDCLDRLFEQINREFKEDNF